MQQSCLTFLSVSLPPSLKVEGHARDQNGKHCCCQTSSCPKGLFLSLSRNTSHNQYILLPQSSPSGKKKKQLITPTQSHLSITHGNLNCHNKVFFQDLSSNSLSFLLEWLSRVSRKSRGGIVIQNRWTLNHRWCREGAEQSFLLGEEGKNSLLRSSKCFSVQDPEYRYLSPDSLRLWALFSCRARWTVHSWFPAERDRV